MDRAPHPRIGDRFADRYELTTMIRRYAAATSFTAHVHGEGRESLITIAEPDGAHPSAWATFSRRAAATGQITGLSHPRFPRTTAQTPPYCVAELPGGRRLDRLIELAGPLPWQRALRVGEGMLATLVAAHAATDGEHGALTPSCCYVDRDDTTWITDYGLETGDAGTASTASCDVRNVGALLFEMMCGYPPPEGMPAHPRIHTPVPFSVDIMVARAHACDAFHGYRELHQLHDELRELLALPVLRHARPPRPTARVTPLEETTLILPKDPEDRPPPPDPAVPDSTLELPAVAWTPTRAAGRRAVVTAAPPPDSTLELPIPEASPSASSTLKLPIVAASPPASSTLELPVAETSMSASARWTGDPAALSPDSTLELPVTTAEARGSAVEATTSSRAHGASAVTSPDTTSTRSAASDRDDAALTEVTLRRPILPLVRPPSGAERTQPDTPTTPFVTEVGPRRPLARPPSGVERTQPDTPTPPLVTEVGPRRPLAAPASAPPRSPAPVPDDELRTVALAPRRRIHAPPSEGTQTATHEPAPRAAHEGPATAPSPAVTPPPPAPASGAAVQLMLAAAILCMLGLLIVLLNVL